MVPPPTRTLTGEMFRVFCRVPRGEEKDFRFGCVEFKSVGMEPRGKRGQGGLHALDQVRKVVFDVGYEDLGVVSVLGHMSVPGACRLRSLAKMVNNRGPREEPREDPWKTPMVFGRGLETALSPEEEVRLTN